MRVTARFLGWRQTEDTTDSLKQDSFLPLLPSATEASEKVRPRAEWSDAKSFLESDGFNISKWRAECDAELKKVEAGSGRQRFVKPVVKNLRLSPLDFTATFVQAAIGGTQHLQRGHVDVIQAARDSYDKQRAWRVRESQTQEGKKGRKLAAEWRDNQEKRVASSCNGVQVLSRPGSVLNEEKWSDKFSARRSRQVKALERIRTQETRNSKNLQVDPKRAASPCENAAGEVELPKDLDDLGNAAHLRHRIKHAVNNSLQQRRKYAHKIHRYRQSLKAKVSEMPDSTRDIIMGAFQLYSSDHSGKSIIAGNLWKALTLVGLRGPTSGERRVIDGVCMQIVASLAKKYGGFEKSSTNPEDGTESDTSRPPTGSLLDHSLDFEEFCAELVPRARREISELRQEWHFSEFMKVLEGSSSVFLNTMQFKRLARRLGIDDAVLVDSGLDKGHKLRVSGRRSSRRENLNDGVLDFETVHEMLMRLEEQHHHRRHKKELEIKAKVQLSDEVFWEYQGELVRLYDHFLAHDKDKCEYLGFTEVKHLLHHLGLQPYRPREGACLDKLMKECDADGSESFAFDEFLELIKRIRTHQRAVREALLRREFGRYVKKQVESAVDNRLDPHAKFVSRTSEDVQIRRQNTFESVSMMNDANSKDRQADDGVDIEKLSTLLGAVNCSGSSAREKEIVDRMVRTTCRDAINFQEFQDLCQNICERLTCEEVEEQYADADALDIDKPKLFLYQWAFDHARHAAKDSTAGVSKHDFPKVLQALLVKPPSEEEVETLLTSLFRKKGTNEISFQMFLEFMNAINTGSKNMLSLHTPFTLKNVAESKLREILALFPLASDYIDQVSSADLADLVGGFLSVRSDADLKEDLHPPIGNVRQLISLAQRKSSARRDL